MPAALPPQQAAIPGGQPGPWVPGQQQLAAQVHQLRQELAQLTKIVLELQGRRVVSMDTKAERDNNGRITNIRMVGKLV